MSNPETKRSELIDRLIINYKTTENIGKLENIVLELETHQVKGIISKAGLLGREKHGFLWQQIESIGKDSIIVHYDQEIEIQLDEWGAFLIGAELWSNSGDKAGNIIDYTLSTDTGKVINYLFSSSGWQGIKKGVYALAPDDVIAITNKRIIADNQAIENAPQYSKGLGETLGKVKDFIQDDYEKTLADLKLKNKEENSDKKEESTPITIDKETV
ncbi:PRC-barrel domain-containing protein [Cyanobacterium stanieri LEGE 03274]|uniref:PRC-barrel domain-containing protein n=1 Tax=Cyanobacterium stanieri LEGE 03274 TaxID=1828756 RepID=A0ABR9V2E8_9CHRO|nr:PRC-barrel domain-containing protein [Cyanobacterium stanieri]MBE9222063.1 PRC-barrel domain-containing protein [Cyanobacterium stanieri LEGE 03274]